MTLPATRALPRALVFALAALPARASDTLELMPDLWVTAVLMVVFVGLIFPLNSLIFRPLMRVMDERDEKIDGAKTRAGQVQSQAQEALDRYEESIRSAHEAANAERRRRLDVARGEMQSITRDAKAAAAIDLGRAREDLADSLDGARETLRGSAQELATLAAERILGRSLS